MHYSDFRIHPYLPSLQPPWVKTFNKNVYDYRDNIPHGSFASLDEFNWYAGKNPRFSHPYALYSAGHAELDLDRAREVDRMLFERDRDNTFLLVDSGGFQVGKGKWSLASLKERLPRVLKWQEAISDLAVILEVPAWMKTTSGTPIEFQTALDGTNANLHRYAALASGDTPFLNVLHGTTFEQCCEWFDKTRWFNDEGYAVGWCFGGRLANDLYLAVKFVLYMLDQGHHPEYLHFLGRGTPESAVIAAVMRRTLSRSYVRAADRHAEYEKIVVTIDSSSEFQAIGRYGTISERAIDQLGKKRRISPFQIKSADFESADRTRFPGERTYPDVEGPVLGKHGKGVVFGDILSAPDGASKSKYNLDDVSRAILTAHNVWVKLDAIERMHRLESGLRRIAYGRVREETYEIADILSRLMHESTRHGHFSDLGESLVASTVGLWKTFRFLEEDGTAASDTYAHRLAIWDKTKLHAEAMFGTAPASHYDAYVGGEEVNSL